MTQPKIKKDKTFMLKTGKRLLGYVTETYKFRLIAVFLCIIVSALASAGNAMFLRVLIDDHIVPLVGTVNPNFNGLLRAIITMAVLFLFGIIANFIYNRFMAILGQSIQRKIRFEMFSHMQKLPIQYFDTHTFGDTMSRFTNDIDTLRQMFSQSIPQVLNTLISITFVFFAMLFTSPALTILIVIMLVITMKIMSKVAGNSAKYFIEQQNSIGKVNGFIEEMIEGQKVIKVFCHEDASKKDFDKLNDTLCEHATSANRYANILMPLMANIAYLQYVILAIIGGIMAINNVTGLTLGALVSFLQLSRSFNMPIGQISQQLNGVIMALAGAGRIFELLDEEEEQDSGYVTLVNAKYSSNSNNLEETKERTGIWAWKHPHSNGTTTYKLVQGDVRFYNVDFAYNKDKMILNDITMYGEPGDKIAFVGATGAGKTTITNLINRFYDIADGKIKYDGININKIKKSDLRRSLGVVLQDTNLFTGTIYENIRYGNLKATNEDVHAAAKLANAHDFITRLPEGYNTVLTGDAAGLSQGQRQLLSIARAAVANPPVMILDEATSSIDTRTEEIVQRGMDALMHGRTVFVIAHRLSTVKNADVIMVMENGHIIERGNHKQLIAERGKYYQLYTGAFELE
jgi:ABC-type multidrug transport system, ATPase and permease components